MNKKYELLEDNCIHLDNRKLYRIKALKDFGFTKRGDIGGYIQNYHNLSQNGNCWIFDDATVFDSAQVLNDARVTGTAQVFENAIVSDNVNITNQAKVYGQAKVLDDCHISGSSQIYDYAVLSTESWINGSAKVFGTAQIYGNLMIKDQKVSKSFDISEIMQLVSKKESLNISLLVLEQLLKRRFTCVIPDQLNETIKEVKQNTFGHE